MGVASSSKRGVKGKGSGKLPVPGELTQERFRKIYSDKKSTGGTTVGTEESGNSCGINDALGPAASNVACQYGHLRFQNAAVFQGTICNRIENFCSGDPNTDFEEQGSATFLTSHGECICGIWIFQRLQYDIDLRSPVALYYIDAQVMLSNSEVHVYKGPAQLILKFGELKLPLKMALLMEDKRSISAKGKDLLKLSLEAGEDFDANVKYAKYHLGDHVDERPNTLLRRQTTSTRTQNKHRIKRDHRVIFWNLCGKEMAPSKWDETISSDLDRTHFHRFLDREAEVAREQSHSILRYVAVAFPQIGYCQGMHCIAKFLLMFSEAPIGRPKTIRLRTSSGDGNCSTDNSEKSEPIHKTQTQSVISLETETAFVLFAQLLEDEKYRLHDLFNPGFEFYRKILADIDNLISNREPVLFAHLCDCGLSAVVYAAKWILTLFTFYVDQDFSSVTNVWLRFLSQGWDAMIEIAVSCVCCVKEHLMNADFEGCMLILAGTSIHTPHGILEALFGTNRGQALLLKYEKMPKTWGHREKNGRRKTLGDSGSSFDSIPETEVETFNEESSKTHAPNKNPGLPPRPPRSPAKTANIPKVELDQEIVKSSRVVNRAIPSRRFTFDT
mmetsp:Transcript_7550/g.12173  ORF Transcript_7550/g.12173 Transcript_7550/m.12173 type:complete len:614 (+) Transcript_7550:371-2212(+)